MHSLYTQENLYLSYYLGAGVVELWSMGPELGRGAADRFVPALWARHPCQAPVPGNF